MIIIYNVDITEKDLLNVKLLKSEFKKDIIALKKLKREVIKDILLTSIISLIIVIFLEMRYKVSLELADIFSLILMSWYIFLTITLAMVICQMLVLNKRYLNKYAYLINNFNITLVDKKMFLEAMDISININIEDCNLIKDDKALILCNNKGFKVVLPIEKIESGEILESELMKVIYGRDE